MHKYILIAACVLTTNCYTMDSKDREIQELTKRVAALEKTVYVLQRNSQDVKPISINGDATIASYKALDNESKQESLSSVLKTRAVKKPGVAQKAATNTKSIFFNNYLGIFSSTAGLRLFNSTIETRLIGFFASCCCSL